MFTILKNEDEWKRFRSTFFTASESIRLLANVSRPMTEEELKIAKENKSKAKTIIDTSILSDGAISYIYEIIANELATLPFDFYNAAMERGKEKEPNAIFELCLSLGKHPQDEDVILGLNNTEHGQEYLFFYDNETNLGATPDVIINEFYCEIKCPDSHTHVMHMTIDTQEKLKLKCPKYYNQIQQGMFLSGRQKGYFVSFDDRFYNKKHHVHKLLVNYDEEHILHLKQKSQLATEYKNQILNKINENHSTI
jgi:hypothetical protein